MTLCQIWYVEMLGVKKAAKHLKFVPNAKYYMETNAVGMIVCINIKSL